MIGKVFWLGGLAAVRETNGELEQRLHVLERKEFVERARRPSVAGETEFAFRHLLVRDVAYAQVPRAVRADMHRRTAEWIESLGRPEDHAEMVAHHYLSALDLSRAAGREVGDLSERARASLGEAGLRATALSALDQAERYLSAALDLTATGDPARPDLLLRLGRVLYLRDEAGADPLEDARDLLAAAGNHEAAAEAALMLADIAWKQGLRDEALGHLAEARSLVADAPPSRARARVLSETARYAMLDERVDEAIRFGREALLLAEELGLDDLRAHALNNIGTARCDAGDMAGGLADLEESIAIAARAQSIADLLRGHNNLATIHVMLGDFERAGVVMDEALRLAENFGYQGYGRFLRGGPLLGLAYHTGSWDQARAGADAFLAEVAGGSPHYQGAAAHNIRALIRVARDDVAGAEADLAEALEAAHLAKDPQILLPALGVAAFVFELAGRRESARELATDVLARLREKREAGFALVWSYGFAWVAWNLGRGDELLHVLRDEPVESPWLEAVRAIAQGEFVWAAELFAGIGAASQEAFFRLRAAEGFVERGDRGRADEQGRRALAFFRSVGATRYVRDGERLLAASA